MSLGVSTSVQAQDPATPADLEGWVIEASIINDRVARQDGQDRPHTQQQDWKIVFVSKDSIRPTFRATFRNSRGTRSGPQEGGGLVTLGLTGDADSRGGGHRVWSFEAGVLTFLRTFEGGAMKATFAVTRTDAGFDCTANVSWPRETGVPNIVMRSIFDDGKMEVVSSKQTASSCKVAKATSAAAPAER